MSREYIGARYVPKFYVNSQGNSDWTPNTSYEALMIVTRNGNSYTSKRPVPAGIGSPENNPTYWASTGLYNTQVEEYRQEVAALSERVTTGLSEVNANIQNVNNTLTASIGRVEKNAVTKIKPFKRVILISDSYGVDSVTGGESWETKLAYSMPDIDFTKYAKGGGGFGWGISSEFYFPNFFTTFVADNNADLVLILCGANDGNLIYENSIPRSAITGGIEAGMSILKQKFPNAVIKMGFIGKHKDYRRTFAYKQAFSEYAINTKFGYEYINNTEFILHNRSFIDDADVHPNSEGSLRIAEYMTNVINNRGFNVEEHVVVETQYTNYYFDMYNEHCELTFESPTNTAYGIPVSGTFTPLVPTEMVALPNLPFFTPANDLISASFPCIVRSGSTNTPQSIELMFRNDRFFGMLSGVVDSTAGEVSLISLPKRFTFRANSIDC